MDLGDIFPWLKLQDEPIATVFPVGQIGINPETGEPWLGIPLTDEQIAGMEMVPEDEISVILNNRDQLSGQWIHVTSTNVEAIRYNVQDASMDVEYQDNRFYKYLGVPPAFFIEFFNAGSPGRFVWDHIRRPNAYLYGRFGGAGTRPVGGGDNIKDLGWL
jgi:hypothetical protein